jgi:hypothetical protein
LEIEDMIMCCLVRATSHLRVLTDAYGVCTQSGAAISNIVYKYKSKIDFFEEIYLLN